MKAFNASRQTYLCAYVMLILRRQILNFDEEIENFAEILYCYCMWVKLKHFHCAS